VTRGCHAVCHLPVIVNHPPAASDDDTSGKRTGCHGHR
jgi:hypothetical protein